MLCRLFSWQDQRINSQGLLLVCDLKMAALVPLPWRHSTLIVGSRGSVGRLF